MADPEFPQGTTTRERKGAPATPPPHTPFFPPVLAVGSNRAVCPDYAEVHLTVHKPVTI